MASIRLPELRRSRKHKMATSKRQHDNIIDRCATGNVAPSAAASADYPAFTFSELFAGISDFRLGLEATSGRCVFANEMDPYSLSIYHTNFRHLHLVKADMLDLCAATDLPANIDILTGGFPCQPFSVRGAQMGLQDKRGQLYLVRVRCALASQVI